ncbi:hypothetical protein C4K02_5605 [Pseudomonas synxantha]|nr:hypothetical protein C4K02_5605 [Pseudomonas synxantha]
MKNALIKEVLLTISVNIPIETQIIKTMIIFPLATQVKGNFLMH